MSKQQINNQGKDGTPAPQPLDQSATQAPKPKMSGKQNGCLGAVNATHTNK